MGAEVLPDMWRVCVSGRLLVLEVVILRSTLHYIVSMSKENITSMTIRRIFGRSIAISLSIAVFFGVLFCTIDDLSAAVSPEHTSHQHTQIHAENTTKYISSREVQRSETEQCCEDLIAVRPTSSLAFSSQMQTPFSRISVNAELLQGAQAVNGVWFSSQKVPRTEVSAKIVQNKRNKIYLKIRPPLGPPA